MLSRPHIDQKYIGYGWCMLRGADMFEADS